MKFLKVVNCLLVSFCFCFSLQTDAATVNKEDLTLEQLSYLKTVGLYKKGKFTEARENARELKNYVLYPYIQYYDLYYDAKISRTPEVLKYINSSKNTGLVSDLQARYVRVLYREGAYQQVLHVRQKPFNSVGLNCIVNSAKYNLGQTKEALNFIKTIYMKQSQIPSECDFLVSKMDKAGMITSATTYTKLLRKFRERRQKDQVAKLTEELKGTNYFKSAKIVNYLYSNPQDMLAKLDKSVTNYKSVAIGSILLLARTRSEEAFNMFNIAKTKFDFSSEQIQECHSYLIRHMMIQKNSRHMKWLDQSLLDLKKKDDLVQNRAKLAIWQENWKDLDFWIKKLPAKEAKDNKWIYWKAYAMDKKGNHKEAREVFLKILNDRSFYSFMVAQRYSIPWPFMEQRVWMSPMDEKDALKKWVEFSRVKELLAIGDLTNAGREWYYFIIRLTPNDAAKAGVLAYNRGWYDYSLKASIYGKAWNMLQLRFPMPLKDYYMQTSRETGVPVSFLYAISRQESALNPSAVSPVGAKGMMQLMPATAALVAKKNNIPYDADKLLEPKYNISLGSRYLQKLLGEYNNNRILAAVAYNAGPHRVEAWRSKDGKGKSVDVWVENIPFNETRNYVQNVIIFDAIYQKYLKQDPYFMTPAEFNYKY